MGAVPLAGAIAQLSWIKGHPIGSVFVPQEAEGARRKARCRGLAKGESLKASVSSSSRTSPRPAARR
jgi:orotate phosphoribosyltransferase